MRGRGNCWVLGVVTVNKLSRPFSDCFQCGPKKSVPVSTHIQNSGYWGRRQVAKNGFIEVFWCLVEICPPLGAPLVNQVSNMGAPLVNQVSNMGAPLINQVSNMGVPLSVGKTTFYHLHTSTGLSPSTSHSLGLPPPLCPNIWSSFPPHTKASTDPHTPPPIWGVVASVCSLWPQCGHLETTQEVTLKSGSSMTLLQFLNLPGCGENFIRNFSCFSVRVGACCTGLPVGLPIKENPGEPDP